MDNPIVLIVTRWLHILPAITLVGGTIFMLVAYVPELSKLTGDKCEEFKAGVRARWAKIVMISAALLIVTGLFNAVAIIMAYKVPGYYHGLLMAKIVLALIVLFLASVLSGRSGLAEKIRRKESVWLCATVVLSVVLVCIAGVMKQISQGAEPKPKTSGSSQAAPVDPASNA